VLEASGEVSWTHTTQGRAGRGEAGKSQAEPGHVGLKGRSTRPSAGYPKCSGWLWVLSERSRAGS
jgi:hypothetical protein